MMPVRKRGRPLVPTPFQRMMQKEAVIYKGLYEKLCKFHRTPGPDLISAEFYRLKANAFTDLMEGQPLGIVLERFEGKWRAFCSTQRDPSGAFPGRFTDAAIHIRNAVDFARRAEAMGLKK